MCGVPVPFISFVTLCNVVFVTGLVAEFANTHFPRLVKSLDDTYFMVESVL